MKVKLLLVLCIITTTISSQNLNDYFSKENVKGGISIYDLKKDTWIHSNRQYAQSGSLPASTFKIIHTLIGLEENIIEGRHDTFRWDGIPKLFKSISIPKWNRDNDLEMAFTNSTIWYFEEIAKRINRKTYRDHLRVNEYTNKKISKKKGNDFWNFGELEVTPIEQIELLIKLYKNELNFKVIHQELVKELLIEQQTSNYILRSKTGWSYDKKDNGWYIGYIELADSIIFFATRVEKELDRQKSEFSNLRKSITKEIIRELYNLSLEE